MKDLFSTLLYSNTFNFLIVVGIFVVVLRKINIKASFINMRDKIKEVVEKSETEKKLAQTELEHTQEELDKLPVQLEKIISDAEVSAVNIAKDIEAKSQDEIKKIEHQAKKTIRFEEKKFYERLASMTSTIAVDLARENAIQELCKNPELHNKFIEEAISELERVDL